MTLKEDRLRTIKYAKSFGCKLSEKQVIERLIGKTIYLNLPVRPRRTPPLTKGGFNKKINKAKKIAKILGKKFKNILFIGVTGSVAAGFPKKNDDIDLFIIVKSNTLWITRFWIRVFVAWNKIPHRKFGKKEKKDEFCFNMWLDESALKLPKNKQNLKNAVDLILMKKLYDKKNTYWKFLKANDWAKKYTATPYYNLLSKSPSSATVEVSLFDKRGTKTLNFLYFVFQYWYLRLKKRKDVVDLHRAMWGDGISK
jgi:predicted nucleotidyltransferase